MTHSVSRRDALRFAGCFAGWALAPRLASAASGRDPRFLFVLLRGALDGLAAVPPVGDPDYERIRQGLIVPTTGPKAGLAVDGFFAVNPNMPALGRMIADREALVVHATATPYRQRSHFDGQDVLESGQPVPGLIDTGWLNRALAFLPRGDRVSTAGGLSIGAAVPLVMRGAQPVVTWIPAGFPEIASDTAMRLLDLYNHTDPQLAALLDQGLKLRGIAGSEAALAAELASVHPELRAIARQFTELASAAGKFLAKPDGPRVAALSYPGWDTHQSQGPLEGRLAMLLSALDSALDALRTELRAVWSDTVVVVATEFGRTVRINGTLGTDHGTATLAILAGGAVSGGRVLADWPGLAPKALFEGRDLAATTDLRAVLKGVLRDHLGVPDRALDDVVFPGSAPVKALSGLLA